MNKLKSCVLLSGVVAIAIGSASGCSNRSADTGMTTTQLQSADRLSHIAQKTGGNWDKLSADDKSFLLKQGWGNEATARMILLGASGKIGHGPTGQPPKQGQPGQPGPPG